MGEKWEKAEREIENARGRRSNEKKMILTTSKQIKLTLKTLSLHKTRWIYVAIQFWWGTAHSVVLLLLLLIAL